MKNNHLYAAVNELCFLSTEWGNEAFGSGGERDKTTYLLSANKRFHFTFDSHNIDKIF